MTLDELTPSETPGKQVGTKHVMENKRNNVNLMKSNYQKTHFTDLVLVPMQNQNKMADAVPGSQSRCRLSPWEGEEEETAVDYHSDFDTDSSARQISEYLGEGDDEEAEVRSEVRSKVTQAVSRTVESLRKTEDDYSSTFSSVRSESFSRSRQSFSQHSGRHASVRRRFKDAAAQTWPDPPGYSWSAGQSAFSLIFVRLEF